MPGVGQLVPSPIPPVSLYNLPANWPTLPNYTLYTPDHLVFPYVRYDLDIEYVWDNGELQAPVSPLADLLDQALITNRQPTPSIQVSAPYGQKIVRFDVARRGVQPVIPSAVSTSENEVLVLARIRPSAPLTSEDGMSIIYRVSGLYVYHLYRPYWESDGLQTGGVTEVDILAPSVTVLPPDNYTTELTNLGVL